MASFKVENFTPGEDSWDSYIERLEQVFIANGVSDKEEDNKKRRAILISVIGKGTYEVLRNLSEPQKPHERSYSELVGLLGAHYSPKPSVIAERHNFHKRLQQSHETVADFVVGLRKLTRFCNFGTFLDSALRDQFVVGLKNKDITQRLYLEADDLTFDKAVLLATSYESAVDNASLRAEESKVQVSSHTEPEAVNVVKIRPARSGVNKGLSRERCMCCGNSNHALSVCRFRKYKCNNCKRSGHLQRMCPNLGQQAHGEASVHNYVFCDNPEVVQEDLLEEEFAALFQLIMPGARPQPWVLPVTVGNVTLDMEIDSGAAISAVSEDTYRKCFSAYSLIPTSVRLKCYNNGIMTPCGTVNVPVTVKGPEEVVMLDLFVVPNGGPPPDGKRLV